MKGKGEKGREGKGKEGRRMRREAEYTFPPRIGSCICYRVFLGGELLAAGAGLGGRAPRMSVRGGVIGDRKKAGARGLD